MGETTGFDPLDEVLDSLAPFDRSVVSLVYGARQGIQRIADTLASTPEQVTRSLMTVYRQVAAQLER